MDRFWHVSKALISHDFTFFEVLGHVGTYPHYINTFATSYFSWTNPWKGSLWVIKTTDQRWGFGQSDPLTVALSENLGKSTQKLVENMWKNPSSSPLWWLQKWWLHRTYFRVPLLSRRRLGKTACGLWSSSNFLAWLEESLDVAFENHHTVRRSKCLWKSVKVLKWWDKIQFLCGSMEFLGRCLIVALNQSWLNQSDPSFFPFCILPMWTSNKNHHV